MPAKSTMWSGVLLTIALWLIAGLARAEDADSRVRAADAWAVRIDDDFLALMQHDRDYTAGLSFTRTGNGTASGTMPLSRLLERIDKLTRFDGRGARDANRTWAVEFGLRQFTPGDLEAEGTLPDDRPYATLAYVTGTRLRVDASADTALQSSLTLGIVGLPAVGALQRTLHEVIGSPLPNGYAHQISDGGEPTFRYAISRGHLLASGTHGGRPYSLHYGVSASFGYICEVGAGLVYRSGPRRSPWWGAPPMAAGYAAQPAMIARPASAAGTGNAGGNGNGRGMVFEAGIESQLRLYNVFLQGQFRNSDVRLSSRQLDHVLVEGWLGFGFRLDSGIELGYTIRRQSREIGHGKGARAFTWGSVSIARRF